MKAILLAGGHGRRLYPFTKYIQKTLLPLHERPVIDYALGTIRRAGIKDITIVSNQFIGQIAKHVGAGFPDEQIHYVLEEEPTGVADALNLARVYNEDCRLLVYFSDNITTVEFQEEIARFSQVQEKPGCVLLARNEKNPEAFGVAVLDDSGQVIDIVEKPENPPSNLAIGGIYMFDEDSFGPLLDALAWKRTERFFLDHRRQPQRTSSRARPLNSSLWARTHGSIVELQIRLLHASNDGEGWEIESDALSVPEHGN